MHVSLDGFVSGPCEEMNWVNLDEDIFRDAIDLAASTDTALYGRITYQMMESYWPTVLSNPTSTALELRHAAWMENINKIVFSKTLERVTWNRTLLIKRDIAEKMTELKQGRGGDMMIFGSPKLTHSFMKWNLIDEYKFNINPVILGNGTPLFENIVHRVDLQLLSEKKFASGVVGLHYKTRNNH